jgi:prepilin peptidase CpaA
VVTWLFSYLTLAAFPFLVAAVISDFRSMRISNRLIALGLIWGLVLHSVGIGGTSIIKILFNISLPVILLYLFFCLRAIGAGDIKLLSMAGAYLSTRQLLYVIAVTFICAAGIGGGKLFYEKVLHRGAGRTIIHFSCPMLIAYVIVVWGWKIV